MLYTFDNHNDNEYERRKSVLLQSSAASYPPCRRRFQQEFCKLCPAQARYAELYYTPHIMTVSGYEEGSWVAIECSLCVWARVYQVENPFKSC